MFINTSTYTEKHKCEACKNKQICKWRDDMKAKQETVSTIPETNYNSPIRVTVSCSQFERILKKQDGFYTR